jgi:hypothetical protein
MEELCILCYGIFCYNVGMYYDLICSSPCCVMVGKICILCYDIEDVWMLFNGTDEFFTLYNCLEELYMSYNEGSVMVWKSSECCRIVHKSYVEEFCVEEFCLLRSGMDEFCMLCLMWRSSVCWGVGKFCMLCHDMDEVCML